jgi:hypothetical protein
MIEYNGAQHMQRSGCCIAALAAAGMIPSCCVSQAKPGALARTSWREFMSILKPYFWPQTAGDRVRAIMCFVCLVGAKVCKSVCSAGRARAVSPGCLTLYAPLCLCVSLSLFLSPYSIFAPIFVGRATSKLVQGVFPVTEIVGYGLMKLGTSTGGEMQRLIYLRVKEVAYR